jgi:two-component system cell cycle response regulator
LYSKLTNRRRLKLIRRYKHFLQESLNETNEIEPHSKKQYSSYMTENYEKLKSEAKILIVDDDPQTLDVINEALDAEGFSLKLASNGNEAFRIVEEWHPNLVITDYDMPDCNGLEMLKRLRAKQNYVTVIFVSAHDDVSLIVQSLRMGADDFITKPFRFPELVARVETCLRNNDTHKQLFQANQKLQDMVEHDYLTGLYNMRSMYERIDYELKRARRYQRQVSCIMLDMDHFKSVNDQNDHLFGSFVLAETGKILQNCIREIDFAARYGGDEFLIVLPETNTKGTQVVCERIRKSIKEHTFKHESSSIQLTASIGFAVTPEKPDPKIDAKTLVRLADHALYESKNSGRDKVSGHP